MPFSCIFQLNNGALIKSDEVIFVEYIDLSFDQYKNEKVKIAKVIYNGKDAFIYSNCPCYISSKGVLKKGDKLDDKTKIGYFSANGEDIPYDKPYAIIRLE